MSNMHDQTILWWRKFKDGDRQALEQIYKRHIADLINYGFKITADADLIKDNIQDLFIELWKTRENLCDVVEIKFYLLKALRNKLYRALPTRSYVDISEMKILPDVLTTGYIELDMVEKEQRLIENENLRDLINKLPARQHEVIYLRFYHNLPYEDISAIMDINYQSVLNLMHRALKALRERCVSKWS